MAKKAQTVTVEDKLRALYDLQLIDSKIDEIRNMRGELPLEVEDLKDEMVGLTKRLDKLNEELKTIEDQVKQKKHDIDTHKAAIKKYSEQQKDVRNNREFNSLAKEIEFQELEIELAEKNIKEFSANLTFKKKAIEETAEKIDFKKDHLGHKEGELNNILAETEKEEDFLLKKSEEFAQKIDERLLQAYQRIRKGVKNGLAVVSLERGAASGSFFTIPPQVQVEIATRKKIMVDEHSGRILVDVELAEEEKEKIDKLISKIK